MVEKNNKDDYFQLVKIWRKKVQDLFCQVDNTDLLSVFLTEFLPYQISQVEISWSKSQGKPKCFQTESEASSDQRLSKCTGHFMSALFTNWLTFPSDFFKTYCMMCLLKENFPLFYCLKGFRYLQLMLCSSKKWQTDWVPRSLRKDVIFSFFDHSMSQMK